MTQWATPPLTIRWTIGNVQPRGFEMLRLSVLCARYLFGPTPRLVISVNTISLEEARRRTGALPSEVEWRHAAADQLAPSLRPFFDHNIIEGMGWKLVPLRVDADSHELSLDNDCILWGVPDGMARWLAHDHAVLFAEDAVRCLGSFDALCPPGEFNAGIRGLPPAVTLERELQAVLAAVTARQGGELRLTEEIEEQGLQAAAIFQREPVFLVTRDEVSLCSPFWPRTTDFGSCGAHFVGMNARHTPWEYYDRPADLWLQEHWERVRPELYQRAGIQMPRQRS